MTAGKKKSRPLPAFLRADHFAERLMNLHEHGSFSVKGYEVNVIPGTDYAFIRLAVLEKALQTRPVERRYVFSQSQLAELRDEIESALRLLKEVMETEASVPGLH
jgi:hypothetical protein